MKKGPAKRPRDTNELAKRIADIATGEVSDEETPKQARARKGGEKGGPARAEALTPEERKRIAEKAARARWEKEDK